MKIGMDIMQLAVSRPLHFLISVFSNTIIMAMRTSELGATIESLSI
jgi:hypothetical protein